MNSSSGRMLYGSTARDVCTGPRGPSIRTIGVLEPGCGLPLTVASLCDMGSSLDLVLIIHETRNCFGSGWFRPVLASKTLVPRYQMQYTLYLTHIGRG